MKRKFEKLTIQQQKTIGLLAFIAFLVFCLVVGWFIGKPMLELVSEPEAFRAWVDAYGLWGKLIFIGMVFFQVVIALVPGEPLEIGAGYAFGAIEGVVLCVIGITLGSLLIFALTRRFGVRFVEIFFDQKKISSVKFLQDAKKRDLLIFLVFFLPGTPKDLLTYFVGLTDIKLSHYLFIVSVARLPSIVTSTVGGSALGEQRYLLAVIVFAVTLVISGLGWWIYHVISKRRKRKEK